MKFTSEINTNGIIDAKDKNNILFLNGFKQMKVTIKDVSAQIK